MLKEFSSTLILNASEWEILIMGEYAEVDGALCRENKQDVPNHNTLAKQVPVEGKLMGKLIMGFS